ncbi:tail protein X [Agrobacterium sp. NPDC090273]|uniref:tail protein X n=1 Tax=Agrobacterium sp. NPDC090273 TaxID=3363919 RepID=UPI00383B07AC
MSNTYITRQGETVDLACLAHYGRTEKVVEAVLDANPGLASMGAVLPIGTKIDMPIVSSTTTQPRLVSLWD